MGAAAIEGLINGRNGVMTGLQGNKIEYVPYEDVFSRKHEMNQNVVKLLDILT